VHLKGISRPRDLARARRNPAKLPRHGKIVAESVMLGDLPIGNAEHVHGAGMEAAIRRWKLGDVVTRGTLYDEWAVLTGVKRYMERHPVAVDEYVVDIETHIGEGPVKPGDGRFESGGSALADLRRRVATLVVPIVSGHVCLGRVEIPGRDDR
jgi:hypothetical protein